MQNKRFVLPLALEEQLLPLEPGDAPTTRRYTVTDDGPLFDDEVGNSHAAVITFTPNGSGGCELEWTCE